MRPLDHKDSVLISGGTSGLGLSIAEHFARLGHPIIFCARNVEKVKSVESHLKNVSSRNQTILGFKSDVTISKEVSGMFSELNNLGINVNILICNAGVIGPIDKFLENTLQEWKNAFDINLFGTINMITAALPRMISQKKGRVIHISGGGATSPLLGMSSYAASKAAAVRFIETLSLEYRDSGVTFNSVAPGMLKTQLLDQMLDAGPERIGEKLFAKSSAKADSASDTTEQAIELIEFLASDESSGISGKLISAEWDNWSEWPNYLTELKSSDLYTLRRVTGRDRGQSWGDR
jgi:NAD(P)-dependent dehydrogenase (short-subunit alcohol dehydrogenase family)